MQTRHVEVPEELFERLHQSRLGRRSDSDQVRIALAIHVYLEGLISIGKAAELVGEPRIDFEWLLSQMGMPVARYDVADYERDLRAMAEAEPRPRPS